MIERDDDRPIGRLLSRREALALVGVGGLALVTAACGSSSATPAASSSTAVPVPPAATPTAAPTTTGAAPVATSACVVRPEQTEGPFFVDEKLRRADVRSDPADGTARPGVPLALTFAVSKLSGSGCSPLAGATVDIWHCDAGGVYSDVGDAVGKRFLRGFLETDAAGNAAFTTIYPGWYEGRTVHIHFKIRTSGGSEFTSQLFFDDALTDKVHATPTYSSRGQRTTRNAADAIFAAGGDQLTLTLDGDPATGLSAAFPIALAI